jgi:hypothetical protein
MNPIKLEFVVFGVKKDSAIKLWNFIVYIFQMFGYDVTGDVNEYYAPEEEMDSPVTHYSNYDEQY